LSDNPLTLSVVIPIKDEAENIEPLAQQIDAALDHQSWSWECIWVDDGSTDGSVALLDTLVAKSSHHRYLAFTENCGQSAAFRAGFQEATGAFIATIDGDGQNDPFDIPRLLTEIQSRDVDMVNGFRARRKDHLVRRLASKIANGFRNLTTGKTVIDVGCSTRIFRRECVAQLPNFKGMHRFLPTLVAMQGFTLAEIPVNHHPRLRGQTKYSINNRLWVGLLDTLGVLWLQKRGFTYRIARRGGMKSG
jgi:dolichol-phosphate mannosyltransferase